MESNRISSDCRGGLLIDEMSIQEDLQMSFSGGEISVLGHILGGGSLKQHLIYYSSYALATRDSFPGRIFSNVWCYHINVWASFASFMKLTLLLIMYVLSNHIRSFIKIPFINKGIDFIDLPSIFQDKSVIQSIPTYFQNSEPPIICYKYNRPIRNTIFNFNKLVSDLDIHANTPKS